MIRHQFRIIRYQFRIIRNLFRIIRNLFRMIRHQYRFRPLLKYNRHGWELDISYSQIFQLCCHTRYVLAVRTQDNLLGAP